MPDVEPVVEAILRAKYPNQYRELVPGAWILVQGEACVVITAADSDQGYSYARAVVPLAVDVPLSSALDAFVARVGRNYEIGRFFLCDRPDQQSTMVVVEEFMPGILFDGANPGALKFMWNVFVSLLNMFDDPGAGGYVRATFGGRPLDQQTEALLMMF